MALTLDCTRSGERGFLDLDGSVDEAGAAELKRRAIQLIATGCNELVFNLERVPEVHPAGLDALARIEAMLPGAKRALTIAGPSPQIQKQVELAGLGEFVEGREPDDYSAEMFGINLVSNTA